MNFANILFYELISWRTSRYISVFSEFFVSQCELATCCTRSIYKLFWFGSATLLFMQIYAINQSHCPRAVHYNFPSCTAVTIFSLNIESYFPDGASQTFMLSHYLSKVGLLSDLKYQKNPIFLTDQWKQWQECSTFCS